MALDIPNFAPVITLYTWTACLLIVNSLSLLLSDINIIQYFKHGHITRLWLLRSIRRRIQRWLSCRQVLYRRYHIHELHDPKLWQPYRALPCHDEPSQIMLLEDGRSDRRRLLSMPRQAKGGLIARMEVPPFLLLLASPNQLQEDGFSLFWQCLHGCEIWCL